MKNTLIVVLSGILVGSALGYDRQTMEELEAWSDRQSEIYDAKQTARRQQDALDDIRWEQARAAAEAQRRYQAQMRAIQAARDEARRVARQAEIDRQARESGKIMRMRD